MDQRPKLKAKTLKLLEGDMRVNLITLDLTKDLTFDTKSISNQRNKVRCHQNLKFCASKDQESGKKEQKKEQKRKVEYSP